MSFHFWNFFGKYASKGKNFRRFPKFHHFFSSTRIKQQNIFRQFIQRRSSFFSKQSKRYLTEIVDATQAIENKGFFMKGTFWITLLIYGIIDWNLTALYVKIRSICDDEFIEHEGTFPINPSFYSIQHTFYKDDKKVLLVPMLHLGETSFYEEICHDLEQEEALILKEGVSNQEEIENIVKQFKEFGVVEESLDTECAFNKLRDEGYVELNSSFDRTAIKYGIDTQMNAFRIKPPCRVINSDIDFSDMSTKQKETIFNLHNFQTNCVFNPFTLFRVYKVRKETDHIREDKVMKLLDEQQASKVICIPWGAHHSASFATKLKNAGWKEDTTQKKKRKIMEMNHMYLHRFQRALRMKLLFLQEHASNLVGSSSSSSSSSST